jgi:predicted chitinase
VVAGTGGDAGRHHNPKALAERAYCLGNPKKAKELGNTQPGDGYRFRGNGMLQLTGRGSHKSMGAKTGFDLDATPSSSSIRQNPSALRRLNSAC